MSLVRWDPWREMEALVDRYNRALGLMPAGGQEEMRKGDWSPRVDIAETGDAFIIKAEIPDVQKEDVKVTLENGVLTLQGERRQETEEKGKTFHRVERLYGVFNRSFSLPDSVSPEGIKASFKDGMLTVTLTKRKETQPKAIEVKIDN
ncbi:Hsp20/alpha crystallin family protein [Desulfuromonas thiophila]|uniref:Heat shock protein Hsp20 n=1 Tax=Desulfuromonas thiophila TaxID=57664 RepID=A0A1G7CBP1_9BACT|nr:Hsp20/alpha crystallin family protein [Desulfuromonas thiophila]SDE36758.1 heat shock protein Hsp20 [Desulfuromonas thiophila]